MSLSRIVLLAAVTLLAGVAPAAARETGPRDLDTQAAFVLRGVDDLDAVSSIGDFDGDGGVDAAVWADDEDELRVVLSGDRVPGLRGFRIAGARPSDTGVIGGGDVTGDALSDLILRVGYSSGLVVVAGSREPRDLDLRRPEQRRTTFTGAQVTFGTGAGDVNGDGLDDLVLLGDVSGRGDDDEGRAYVLFGGPALRGEIDLGDLGDRGFRVDGGTGPAGFAAAAAGDVDGDGLGDVVIGDPFAGIDVDGSDEGSEDVVGGGFVVFGRRTTDPVDLDRRGPASMTIEADVPGFLGLTVTGVGDMNGDGLAEVALSAPVRPTNGPAEDAARGDVLVLLGDVRRRETVDADAPGGAGFWITGAGGGAATGFALAPAGDVDGDARADLLVGAPGLGDRPDGANAGAAHLVYGAADPAGVALAQPGERGLSLRGTSVERAGSAVAAGTDLDGDGQRELLVSRPGVCRVGRLDEGDVVAIEPGSPAPAPGPGFGSAGADRLGGGPVGETLLGFDAADEIVGRDGHDCISGGEGDDRLSGGRSGDAMFGEAGADLVTGDSGCDRLFGGDGDDVIRAGPDLPPPEARLQSRFGAFDRDEVLAGAGDDVVTSGADHDRIAGGRGEDRLHGRGDDDALEGGRDADRLFGGSGSDTVVGGFGSDVIRGGTGRDFLGGDVDLGFDAEDGFGNRPARSEGDDDMAGGSGPDQLHGEGGRDRLDGGSGDDQAQGMRGDDRLLGGPGEDNLQGGAGADRMSGGSGRDVLGGAAGEDTLLGGSFGDVLDGGNGADRLYGGGGPDRLDARDGKRDVVRCGAGLDRATVDRLDSVRGCEVVNGRRRG